MLAHKFCDACAWTERPIMSRNELRSSGERIIYARFCEWARLSFFIKAMYKRAEMLCSHTESL